MTLHFLSGQLVQTSGHRFRHEAFGPPMSLKKQVQAIKGAYGHILLDGSPGWLCQCL